MELKIEIYCEGGVIVLDGGRVAFSPRAGNPKVLFDAPMPTPSDGFQAAMNGFLEGRKQVVSIDEAIDASVVMEDMLGSVMPRMQ